MHWGETERCVSYDFRYVYADRVRLPWRRNGTGLLMRQINPWQLQQYSSTYLNNQSSVEAEVSKLVPGWYERIPYNCRKPNH